MATTTSASDTLRRHSGRDGPPVATKDSIILGRSPAPVARSRADGGIARGVAVGLEILGCGRDEDGGHGWQPYILADLWWTGQEASALCAPHGELKFAAAR